MDRIESLESQLKALREENEGVVERASFWKNAYRIMKKEFKWHHPQFVRKRLVKEASEFVKEKHGKVLEALSKHTKADKGE